jgi:hypothetical protein
VLLAFRAACAQHNTPASTLTDNGMAFTTRLAGGKGGRNALEHERDYQPTGKRPGWPKKNTANHT